MPDDWFEDWFGEEYLALYEHRDHHEAREVVALIVERMGEQVDAPVLDLACGAGRHQRTLCDRGWWTVGLDLSPSLLRAARAEDRTAPLVRADMRELPFADASFARHCVRKGSRWSSTCSRASATFATTPSTCGCFGTWRA